MNNKPKDRIKQVNELLALCKKGSNTFQFKGYPHAPLCDWDDCFDGTYDCVYCQEAYDIAHGNN